MISDVLKSQGICRCKTTLVTVSSLPIFIALFTDDEIPGTPGTIAAVLITFVLNLAFALSLLGFLIMHISLVAGNTTTIEAFEKKSTPKSPYDLGWKINFEQDMSQKSNASLTPPSYSFLLLTHVVFGKNKKYWFIPLYSEDDIELDAIVSAFGISSKARVG
ncbi:hypothetical protein Patl1_18575 [Pistacia atlantica]|uniref:Uncharacterized protein n=1 Tax=Pistacia atlantica TaxID=434234 RepID=A0ACC1BXT5_9ROSI|nr:hypothetical protein Patl1_18575 [Pistacia atlantica]